MRRSRVGRLLVPWLVVVGSIAGCHRSAATPAVEAAPAPATLRLGLLLLDADDPRADSIKSAAEAAKAELRIECANGRFSAQTNQAAALLDEKVVALLLVPSSPDLLHSIGATVATKSVPLITIGRGDGSVGGWVGLKSGTLAREAGDAAARRLRALGVMRPRVIAVESTRWSETTRRNEGVLAAMQKEFGSLDLPIRLHDCETEAATRDLLIAGLPRMVPIDAIVAAEPATTAGAWAAVQKLPAFAKTLVVGVTDDETLQESARASDARLVLVCWKRADLATKAVGAALRAIQGGEKLPIDEVAAELVGAPASGR